MTVQLEAAYHWTLGELAGVFNEAFTGYIGGNIHVDEPSTARFFARDNVDLALSQVITQDDHAVGLGLIARQGWTSRLAAMGIIPAATGQGIGKTALAALVEQARARGDHQFDLEVIEQNERGVRLYEGAGFQRVRRLVGYDAQSPQGDVNPSLERIDIAQAAKVIVQYAADDCPRRFPVG